MTDAATALRAKQKPLKDAYRTNPSSALITLTSTGTLDTSAGLSCSLATASQAKKVAGLHPAAGGPGFDASGELCSGDMLLESLVACFGVTIRAVATSMGIPIEGGSITCEGDLDFRGTLGIKGEDGGAVPVGFKGVRLRVELKVPEEHRGSLGKLVSLSERYCVVLQTIRNGVSVETVVEEGGKADGLDGGVEDGQEKTVKDEDVIKLQ